MTRRERGQAAVETAIVLPLVLFLILGTLQLFLLQQSRIAAQYATFQAARTGSISHGACRAMTHAALLSLLANVHSFIGDTSLPGTPAQKLGASFARISDNHYGGFRWGTWTGPGTNTEAILWIVREGRLPTAADVVGFDRPLQAGSPFRMELRVVYWAPLRIPFADWVYARIAAARMVGMASPGIDILVPTRRTADWSGVGYTLESRVAAEFSRRMGLSHYVFPITVSATMRMMTPPRLSEFTQAECPSPGFVP